jgi:putative PIN family toxin of toxin-antitoxin system
VVIFDTNIWISYTLNPRSELSIAVDQTIETSPYAMSTETFAEFGDVLLRNKFDRFVSVENRRDTLERTAFEAKWFTPTELIRDCRDPKDNKFLELAVAAKADFLITGDDDLLILDPFRKTRILTIAQFIQIQS